MYKTKIAIVGPPECGKTYISNFLSEATESSLGEYHPTRGVRILEYEVAVEDSSTGKFYKAEVELWDCGGSQKLTMCWPAIVKDNLGIIIVYNPDNPDVKELEKWFTYFVKQQGLSHPQCLLIAHHKPGTSNATGNLDSPMMGPVHCIHSNIEEDPEGLREAFSSLIAGACEASKANQDKAEEGIMRLQ